MLREPPDVLITTPESLYLMLTSRAREILRGAEWVIVDEIHAVAGTKRGAHLALTLERLDALAQEQNGGREVQRIGLSATQNPLEEVGRFMVGPRRRCRIVDTGVRKPLDLKIHVPVESMVEPDADARARLRPARRRHRGDAPLDLAGDLPRAAEADPAAPLDDPVRQQPPLRRADRAAAERAGERGRRRGRRRRACRPAGRDRPRPPRLARARGAARRRGAAEGGRDPVHRRDLSAWSSASTWAQSTSSCRSSRRSRSPPDSSGSAAPGTTSATRRKGRIFPKFRADLLECAVVARRMRDGAIEPTVVPRNPLDVLAQQIVAIAAAAGRTTSRSQSTISKRSSRAPTPTPSCRARSWRTCSTCSTAATRRPSSPSCARASCGTASPARSARAEAPARSPSRTPARSPTAASSWSPCPTAAASASWTRRWSTRRARARRSCSARRAGGSRRSVATAWSSRPRRARPARSRSGRATASAVRRSWARRSADSRAPPSTDRSRSSRADYDLDELAARNLLDYLAEQQQATRVIPSDKTIVIERFRDEIGDWRLCVLSPFGGRIHAAWGLALQRPHPRPARPGGGRDLERRRDHRPPARRGRAAGRGHRADRAGRAGGRGRCGAVRLRPLRRALPRERRPLAADPARLPGQAHAACGSSG